MQLIETETTLDIERTMSTVDDVHNNKPEKFDIEDLNQKCNGNTKDAEEEGSKKVISEIEEVPANTPANLENNEAELSNVDLSNIISEQNKPDVSDADMEESQKNSLESTTNGIEKNNKGVDGFPQEEEDYLEDDIISIREECFDEPFSETAPKIVKTEGADENESAIETVTELNGTSKDDTNVERVDSPIQNENKASIEDIDEIELIDESVDSPKQKEITSTITEDQDEVEIIEESENVPVKCEKVKEEQITENIDDLEVIEELKTPSVHPKDDAVDEVMDIKVDVKTEADSSEEKVDVPKKELDIDSNETIATERNQTVKCDKVSSPSKETVKEEMDLDIKMSPQCIESIDCDIENDNEVKCEEASAVEDKDVIELIEEAEESHASIEVKEDKLVASEAKLDEVSTKAKEFTGDANSSDLADCGVALQITPQKVATKFLPIVTDDVMDVDEVADEKKNTKETVDSSAETKDDRDVEEVKNNKIEVISEDKTPASTNSVPVNSVTEKPIICKLSNTLDILSDDEDEEPPKADLNEPTTPKVEPPKASKPDTNEKQCISIEDDDDIMLIDEDSAKTDNIDKPVENKEDTSIHKSDEKTDSETGEKTVKDPGDLTEKPPHNEIQTTLDEVKVTKDIEEKVPETIIENSEPVKPLVPDNFLKTAKTKLSDMTRDDLEEFCILKIVESIVDRSSLSEIKNKLKVMSVSLEEYRRKAMMLTRQNRDLQVVLKSVQEEQKKATGDTPITPLKITRSVGMQVYMEKQAPQKKPPTKNSNNKNTNQAQNKNAQTLRSQKNPNQPIPVPRLVPANSPALKTPSTIPQVSQMGTPGKSNTSAGALKTPPSAAKPEKRQFSKVSSSVTVDLTDDEPPSKIPSGSKISPAPPVRLVPPQNLMAPQRQAFGTAINSPRKVYIPISGTHNQNLRPGQTIMLKTVPAPGLRQRAPTPQTARVEQNPMRLSRISPKHPAPLPFPMKQYQPPNWKALPPAPDVKLSKVENGIVISWKIEGVAEDSYEEIASYQLYAYQETTSPPSTSLWKKIGDVKALPLPMACTLTQFMAGFKYYFAVRAVDIRSRLGPFSLPGSILLLSKNIYH